MLTLAQLDRHRRDVALVHKYEALLETYGTVRASKFDGVPIAASPNQHRLEEMVLKVETAREELPRLKTAVEIYEDVVKESIREICGGNLKLALVFRMRFLTDHEWDEIEHLLRVKNPETMVREALLKAYREEE